MKKNGIKKSIKKTFNGTLFYWDVLDYKILNEDFAKKICGELREKNIANLDEARSKGPKIVGAERYDCLWTGESASDKDRIKITLLQHYRNPGMQIIKTEVTLQYFEGTDKEDLDVIGDIIKKAGLEKKL